MPDYVIWSTRLGGWVSVSGGTSDWKEARKFKYVDALSFCHKQRDHMKAPICFPVAVADLERLSQ